jgi:uncharacterized protein YidB (DUF937 family)
MGLFDNLVGDLESAIGSHPGGVSGVLGDLLADAGGLDGVVAKLNEAGLGEKVNSWLGKGENAPLTADEIRAALSDQSLTQIAGKLGISTDAVAQVLAQHLPNAVDQASPGGTLAGAGAAGGGVRTA